MDPLDKIYTADEAAERLRTTRRLIIKVGRELGACSVLQREYLFSEADLLKIWHAKRALPVRGKTGFVGVVYSDREKLAKLTLATAKRRRR
ncbi:hypothetical protein J5N58_08215 [Rhizobium cremeum]|uniref:hypothetical protein n=1 Tax=Rhizobium cremeum TaxID=2813827 RepID=UPI001FD1C0A5|nr:hypothetical protein [Rhizobium cremeum]MCJ7995905.1 hypothetical protein [Rhizobium cremeum]MCJ7999660.1 hypothetical protein [Rhizobium cremeum]